MADTWELDSGAGMVVKLQPQAKLWGLSKGRTGLPTHKFAQQCTAQPRKRHDGGGQFGFVWLLGLSCLLSTCAEPGPSSGADVASWRLYTYTVPLVEELGVSAEASHRYWSMLAADFPSLPWDNGGVSHYLVRDLPSVIPKWTPPPEMEQGWVPWEDNGRVVYLLPIAPYVLCAATDFWGVTLSNPLMHAKGGFSRWRGSGSMYRAQSHCLRNETLTCPTYEKTLRWMLGRPSWKGREHRHAFALLGVEVPRVAFSCDVRRGNLPETHSVYSRIARAILITTEGRRWSWRMEREQGYLVTTPQWWPSFFMLNATAERLPTFKTELVAMKSVAAKFCHRYDDRAHPTRLWCGEGGVSSPDPFKVRAALVGALKTRRGVGAVKAQYQTGRGSFMDDPEGYMRGFAEAYHSAIFTLVPHGDTVTSSRIYQAMGALSIPVFLIDVEHLPFQKIVPWKEISIFIDPYEMLEWAKQRGRGNLSNPLDRLSDLVKQHPERVCAMQRKLAEVRWHLLYHRGDHRAVPFDSSEPRVEMNSRPSVARSVAHDLIIAAHTRELAHRDPAAPKIPSWLAQPRVS